MAGDIRTLLIWAKLYHGFADHVGLALSPLRPLGIAGLPTLYEFANASTGHHEENWEKG